MALRGHTRVLCNAGEERQFVLVDSLKPSPGSCCPHLAQHDSHVLT